MMGRPSKLTLVQWKEVERRLLAGETARSLGREFAISEAAIRKKFGANQSVSAQSAQVRTVAKQIAAAQTALETLPPAQRGVAMSLAEKLVSIRGHMASAAEYSAATTHRLHAMATSLLAKVDDADPLASVETMKGVAVLTRLANDSSHIALNLMAANKPAVEMATQEQPPRATLDVSKLSDLALQELLAARV
jgi:hypothetical protein